MNNCLLVPNERCMLLILGQCQFSFYSSRMANLRAKKTRKSNKVLSANKSHNCVPQWNGCISHEIKVVGG